MSDMEGYKLTRKSRKWIKRLPRKKKKYNKKNNIPLSITTQREFYIKEPLYTFNGEQFKSNAKR